MSEQSIKDENVIFNSEKFTSCFARSCVVNANYKQIKSDDFPEKKDFRNLGIDGNVSYSSCERNGPNIVEEVVRYRKNSRSSSIDDSRRFSCSSVLNMRSSMIVPKRAEIPVDSMYYQNKIETLQWQLNEAQKGRDMYKALMKQMTTFLKKAHVSLENLSQRINRKNSVPRSKSEHHIEIESTSNVQSQRSLVEEHLSSWTSSKNPAYNSSDEVPPEKLAIEAFRLLRTAESLLNTEEPKLTSSENLSTADESADVEFLAQLAREFPSPDPKSLRSSFSVSPKLILPDGDVKISTAFNRKLSLQLGDVKKNARGSVTESEYHSTLSDRISNQVNFSEARISKCEEKSSTSPATGSISSMEDESGFSSMNSFHDVGLPLVNSTAIEEVSARSVLLKSMLHNTTEYNQSDSLEATIVSSPFLRKRNDMGASSSGHQKKPYVEEERNGCFSESTRCSGRDIQLWQKPENKSMGNENSNDLQTINHKRWHSTPDQSNARTSRSAKVLWV